VISAPQEIRLMDVIGTFTAADLHISDVIAVIFDLHIHKLF